jgi:hypothetical protein
MECVKEKYMEKHQPISQANWFAWFWGLVQEEFNALDGIDLFNGDAMRSKFRLLSRGSCVRIPSGRANGSAPFYLIIMLVLLPDSKDQEVQDANRNSRPSQQHKNDHIQCVNTKPG